jgi:hypothetical protein
LYRSSSFFPIILIKEVCGLKLFAAIQADEVVKLIVRATVLAFFVVAVFPIVIFARLEL